MSNEEQLITTLNMQRAARILVAAGSALLSFCMILAGLLLIFLNRPIPIAMEGSTVTKLAPSRIVGALLIFFAAALIMLCLIALHAFTSRKNRYGVERSALLKDLKENGLEGADVFVSGNWVHVFYNVLSQHYFAVHSRSFLINEDFTFRELFNAPKVEMIINDNSEAVFYSPMQLTLREIREGKMPEGKKNAFRKFETYLTQNGYSFSL